MNSVISGRKLSVMSLLLMIPVELTYLVLTWSAVRNQSEIETSLKMRGMSPFFCQTGSAETHTKPCKTTPQGTSIKRPAIYWDHAVSWGGGGVG